MERHTSHLDCRCVRGSTLFSEHVWRHSRGDHSGRFCNKCGEKVAVAVAETQNIQSWRRVSIVTDGGCKDELGRETNFPPQWNTTQAWNQRDLRHTGGATTARRGRNGQEDN